MVLALLLAVANPDLDRFDDANLALTSCGFAAHRSAAAAGKSLSQFKAELPTRCGAEIAAMRRAIVQLDTGRGKSRAAATARADESIARFQAFFADGYARRHEDEAKLKALIEAMEQEGKLDAQ